MVSYSNKPPECAELLNKSWRIFVGSKLLKEWEDAPSRVRRVISPGINNWDVFADKIERPVGRTKPRLAQRISNKIVQQLKSGLLVAWGRDGQHTADFVRLPADAWGSLKLNLLNNEATHNTNPLYFSIRVLPAEIADTCWDGGLKLLEAGKVLDKITTEEIENPWAPELADGQPDQDWADGSREYAADQMWRIIREQISYKFLSLFVCKPETNEWRDILDGFVPWKLPNWEKVDFAQSQIQMPDNVGPVACLITRYDERPSNKPKSNLSREDASGNHGEDVPSRRLLKGEGEKIYLERVKEWPKDKRPPRSADDINWIMKNLNVSRERAREVRRDSAPKEWKKTGPKLSKSDK